MRMDKMTNPLQLALSDAQSLAVGRDHNFIEPLHLLAALLQQQGGMAKPLLAQAGVKVAALEGAVEQSLEALPRVTGGAGDLHLSNEAGRVLNQADKLSQQRGDDYISSELVLLAILTAAHRK